MQETDITDPFKGIGQASIAFGLFMLVYGKMITGIGFHIMPFFAAGFIALSLITSATQPEADDSGAAKLKKISQNKRMLLSVLSVLLMVGVDSLAVNPFVIIAADAFYFAGYGILLPTYREITEKIVPDNIKTTAHGLCDAVFSSLAGMIALLYSGVIMDAFSITTLLILCFVLSCLALGMCLLFVRTNRMKKEGLYR